MQVGFDPAQDKLNLTGYGAQTASGILCQRADQERLAHLHPERSYAGNAAERDPDA